MAEPEDIWGLNEPAPAPKLGGTGRRRQVSAQERLQRHKFMHQLLLNGVPNREIDDIMADKFGMSGKAATRLRTDILNEWEIEDKERASNYRQAAIYRLHGHINGARKDASWNAIAQLEHRLSRIQGTEAPTEVIVNVHATTVAAVTAVFDRMPQDQLMALLKEPGDDAQQGQLVSQTPASSRRVVTVSPEDG